MKILSGPDIRFEHIISAWIMLMIITSAACLHCKRVDRNYSQVDKLWSVADSLRLYHVASAPSPRLILMALLITIWGLRLSYNFYRKGRYNIIPWKGTEDYRWKVMREQTVLKGRIRFGIFNLLFISIYQNIVIFLFSSPLLLCSRFPDKSMTLIDLAAAAFMLFFIITEKIADDQLSRFHQEKLKAKNERSIYTESLKKGFLTEGLWKYVRHPNFTSEQCIWISFYFFGVAASGKLLNITVIGPLLLVIIFIGSSAPDREYISKKVSGIC